MYPNIFVTFSFSSFFLCIGSSVVPRQLGYRLVFLLLFVWAMFIYQFYTSSIVSTLLFAPSQSIHTLADLAHSNVRIGFEDVLTSKDALNVNTTY